MSHFLSLGCAVMGGARILHMKGTNYGIYLFFLTSDVTQGDFFKEGSVSLVLFL